MKRSGGFPSFHKGEEEYGKGPVDLFRDERVHIVQPGGMWPEGPGWFGFNPDKRVRSVGVRPDGNIRGKRKGK
jgi:hypothetical protein